MTNGRKNRDPAGLTDRTLVGVLRGRSQSADPAEALRELLRRGSAPTPLLAEIVADPGRPPDLRANAAVAIGRSGSAEARQALAAAVTGPDDGVIRRSAEWLGRIGDPSALGELGRASPTSEPARRSVDFARSLISYRHRLGRELLRPPPAAEAVPVPDDAKPLVAAPPSASRLAKLLGDAAQRLPETPLTGRGAIEFNCNGHDVAILLAADLDQFGLPAVDRGDNALLGIVLERSPTGSDYFLAEYVLANPVGRGGSAELIGVRPNGVVAHFGMLDPGSGAFGMRSADNRISPPVAIEGHLRSIDRSIEFTRLVSSDDFTKAQKQPRTPRPL